MFYSEYYTCEQIDQRLLQGYVDDYNEHNGTNLTKEEFLSLLNNTIDNYHGLDNYPTYGSNKYVYSKGIYNFVGEYAILYHSVPILDIENHTFTLPAGSHVIHYKNNHIESTEEDIVWNRSDASLYAVGFLILNVSNGNTRVVPPISLLPSCSDDECIIALVDWWKGIIKCNVASYYVGSTLVNNYNPITYDQTFQKGSLKPITSNGVYNLAGQYAFITNGVPILNTVNKSFTIPSGTYIGTKEIEITLETDITWNRSDTTLKAGGYLILDLTTLSHRVVPIPNIPSCSDDECIIALVNWWNDVIKCNVPSYYVNNSHIFNTKYNHSYLSRPVFWRQGHIEIVKNRTSSAKLSVRVIEDCLFFLTDTWVTIQSSETYIDSNIDSTALLGIKRNSNNTYSIALVSYSDLYNSDFYVLTSVFYNFGQNTGIRLISTIDATIKSFITFRKEKRVACEWAWPKYQERYNVHSKFSKEFLFNRERILELHFSITDPDVVIRVRSPYLNLTPGGIYSIVQNGFTNKYLYQVLDVNTSTIGGGYKTNSPFEFTVPNDGIVQIMLKKSDNSEFTAEDIDEINSNSIFELYNNNVIIQKNNLLSQEVTANLWGSTEFLDGYFYGINPNANPVTYQGLTANAAMTCCEVPVRPGTKLYTLTPYLMLAYLDENRNFVGSCYYIYSSSQPTKIPRITEVPWNAVYAQISTRLSYKYETVVTECPFPSVGLESYRDVSKQLIPRSQIIHQELNRIYDRKSFVSNAAQNSLGYVGTVALNGDKLNLASASGVYVTGLHTTVDKSVIETSFKVTTVPSSGKLIRFGYYGSKVVGTGITNCDVWIDVYSNKVELYDGNLSGTTATKKAEANLSGTIAVNDEIELRIEKDSIYHYVAKVLKRYVVIGEIELTATVDPNDSDHALNQMRGWGAPAVWTGTGATITINSLTFYSICPQYAKLAIVGDSYVENMSRSKASGWVRLLEEKIGKDNIFISGQGGGSASALLTKLPVELNLCRPKYVILHTGTNDAGTGTQTQIDNYKTRLLQLIDMVKAINAIPILMTTPRVVNSGNDDLAFINTINPWVKSLGYKYVDIAYCLSTGDGVTIDTNRMRPDLVHPNHVGAEAILNWVEINLPEIL